MISAEDRYAKLMANRPLSSFRNKDKSCTYGYIRVSLQKQVQHGYSLEQQRENIIRYCKQSGRELTRIFEDAGISGKNTEDRPGFLEMQSILKKGDFVCVKSVDRLGRNAADLVVFNDYCVKNGIHLIVTDMNLDTSAPGASFIFGLIAQFGQMEREATNKRISDVMQTRKANGYAVTKAPFGYKVVDKKLVPDDQEQEVINMIADMLLDDPKIKLVEICRRLKEKDVKIRKSKDIYPTSIRNIIIRNKLRDIPILEK